MGRPGSSWCTRAVARAGGVLWRSRSGIPGQRLRQQRDHQANDLSARDRYFSQVGRRRRDAGRAIVHPTHIGGKNRGTKAAPNCDVHVRGMVLSIDMTCLASPTVVRSPGVGTMSEIRTACGCSMRGFFRPTPAVVLAASLVVGTALRPAPVGGQSRHQFSIAAAKEWVSFERAFDPVGISLGWTVYPNPTVGLRVVWSELWGSRDNSSTYCDSYGPDFTNCDTEPATHQARLRRIELGVSVQRPLGVRWRLDVGAGVSMTWLWGSGHSLTSNRRDSGEMAAAGYGMAGWLGIDRWLDGSGRFSAFVELHRLFYGEASGCATDTATPFCGPLRATNIRIGLNMQSRRAPGRQ